MTSTHMLDGTYGRSLDVFTAEAESWQAEAERWKTSYENCHLELEEYVAGSQELERELDQELQQCKQRVARLETDVAALTEVNRGLKAEGQKADKRNAQLEEEIKQVNAQRQALIQQRRSLEQSNDEMENNQRILSASLGDQTRRVEELTEAKAMLEVDLEEVKQNQKETEQRLRDEVKDLRDELASKSQPISATRHQTEKATNNAQEKIIDSMPGNRPSATGYSSRDFRSDLIPSNPSKLRDGTVVITANSTQKKPELRTCDRKEAFCSLIPRANGLRSSGINLSGPKGMASTTLPRH